MIRDDQYITIYGEIDDDGKMKRPYIGRAVSFTDAELMAKALLSKYDRVFLKDKNDWVYYYDTDTSNGKES